MKALATGLLALSMLLPVYAYADSPATAGSAAYYGPGVTGTESPASQGWGGTTFAALVGQIISIVNLLVAFLGSVALAIFLWGGVRYLYKTDELGKTAQKEFLGWSLVALFVLVSIFGILQIVQSILPA